MRSVVRFGLDEVLPPQDEVLQAQGIPDAAALSARLRETLDGAYAAFRELAEPVAVLADLPAGDFAALYVGEGCNPPDSPLPAIVPRACALALYAATVGERASARIGELFAAHDLALAYFLDRIASSATDRLAGLLAERFASRLRAQGLPAEQSQVLPYSPGYCGWHVSGQRRLFDRLGPGEIGIHLNDSFLMTPLKSVSGVLVAGPGEAHRFRPDYPVCEACATHECGRRMASVLRH
jgi:hypothetical protein